MGCGARDARVKLETRRGSICLVGLVATGGGERKFHADSPTYNVTEFNHYIKEKEHS